MIRVLPAEVVNQIAAGEVIERPFSVVKELVENSLDAGARSVRIEIDEGGHERIRVSDDGGGFRPEDLELAFASHATSKLGDVADLDHIASLGFRGEALASIGSVARTSIRSRQGGSEEGCEVRAEGGRIGPVRPCAAPVGTAVEVRDLFFNVPARRRFLKSARAERTRVREVVQRLALARLDVAFTLVVDGREVLALPAGEGLRSRVGRTFGKRLAEGLLDVELAAGGLHIEGLVAEPDLARRDGTMELLFVNGRCARDRSATHAVRQACREYLMGGRFPVYFLMLSLPPDEVDVNVHPSKAEVRFLDGRKVSGLLHRAVEQALRGRGGERCGGLEVGDKPRAASGFPDLPADLFGRAGAEAPGEGLEPERGGGGPREVVRERPVATGRGPAEGVERRVNPFRGGPRRFLQVMDLYLLFEGEDGLVVVDQHALHERVLYEKLRERSAGQPVAVQRLLTPAVCELAPADKDWVLDAREALEGEGLLVEDFGGAAVAVQGVPAVLGRTAPQRVLELLLHGEGCDGRREDRPPSAREVIVERFHSMACRAAVMAGDRLREEEIAQLLEDAAGLEHPHNCPHGRPTVVTFSGRELERYFRRI